MLIAGGIGITPFMAHLHELQRSGQRYHLHYCFHSEEHNAFQQQLTQAPFTDNVSCHVSSLNGRLDLARTLADVEPGAHIYVCGPAALNEAVYRTAAELGIAPVACTAKPSPPKTRRAAPLRWCWPGQVLSLKWRKT